MRRPLLATAALALMANAPAVHPEHAPALPTGVPHAKPLHSAGHWGYEGEGNPEHWGELSDEFKTCKVGRMQSPIDLGGADVAGRIEVRTAYKPGALTILNNGHTVQVNFPEGSVLSSGISRYKLVQVHFHTPSEETVYGVPYPMVAHFVHTDHAGNLAVLGVLFQEGAHNPELDKIVKAAPAQQAGPQVVSGVTLNPALLMPQDLSVWRYDGSLTTPPCSEGVRWHVASHPVTASAGQIAAIHAIVGDNARPIQPRNGRLLVAGTD